MVSSAARVIYVHSNLRMCIGSTFGSSSERISLTSARIGESVRHTAYSLPSRQPESPDADTSAFPSSKPILRKSYRKTLRTVEGIRVRMKNCFVPYVPMSVDPNSDPDAAVEEDAAGSEERTVILSVEIENSDSGLGFVVENVSLTISGGLAHATLIGWGDSIHTDVFPPGAQGY